MELLQELDKEFVYGRWRRMGLFRCPFCGKVVKRYYYNGIKDKSCGCRERMTHGQSRSRLYKIWAGMKSRCSDPNKRAYRWYGARGIKISKEWDDDFIAFMNWSLAHGYADNLTIDRVDRDQDYSPDNCRWIPASENRKRAPKRRALTPERVKYAKKMLAIGEKEVAIAAELGVSKHVISRIARGKTYREVV